MSKIQKYAKSSELMDVSIKLENGEVFKFNLYEELEISEDRINFEATQLASSYAFISTLRARLAKVVDDRKLEKDKLWAKAYVEAKRTINNDTGRPYSDDAAKAQAELDTKYLKMSSLWNEAKYKVSLLEGVVKAFETRASLIQTISANNRKEK